MKKLLPALLLIIAGAAFTYGIMSGRGSPESSVSRAELQPDDYAALVRSSMLDFDMAIRAGDLRLFWATTAPEFRGRFTAEQFQQAFRGFLDQRVNLAPVQELSPVFIREPGVRDDGLLDMAGYFPTEPSQVHFDLQYARHVQGWRLVGVNVGVGQPEG